METKLCRICGSLGQNYTHIFKTEGLRNKIETCLPIIVSPHCLLPDTICGQCSENVDNFYSFIKNCLQNIIILEAQYDITESCLKTKRKHDKGCLTDIGTKTSDKAIQTDDLLDILFEKGPNDTKLCSPTNSSLLNRIRSFSFLENANATKLVDYEVESDTCSEAEDLRNSGKVILEKAFSSKVDEFVDSILSARSFNKQYFDDRENTLIGEITQRKNLKRRTEAIENNPSKICKFDSSNRRKSKQPKKVEYKEVVDEAIEEIAPVLTPESVFDQASKDLGCSLFQICLLCETKFPSASALAAHVFEGHGVDMAQIALSADSVTDKKKRIPNLVKISDLKKADISEDNLETEATLVTLEEPEAAFELNYLCNSCSVAFALKVDLFAHLRLHHPNVVPLTCGICLYQAASLVNLRTHLDCCQRLNPPTARYLCQICKYGEDNAKSLENHVLIHDFLLDNCKKQGLMFDPEDYIEKNSASSMALSPSKSLSCSDCGLSNFDSFKDFSCHRRSKHSIFHCDLCNKFYGRNSHLWKHVNRLHKGHPSITCQLCYKTSASKYHLAQHFNKIHTVKPCKKTSSEDNGANEGFMAQKFAGFDFQHVKQSFLKQEMLEQERKASDSEVDENSNPQMSDQEPEENEVEDEPQHPAEEPQSAPKEIDASSDLYTNIITNYTPPVNEGEYKCPKCSKGFHKKNLLKKHKKNCRPRLQKDLLTRCKSCARIFKDRQSLAKHLVNYHSEYVCEICSQKVQSKCEIVAHIRFTHPGCHLVCKICKNILRRRADLIEHMQDHSNSYICQFCADPLPSKIKLKMHILSLHRKILSLSCGVCLKLFETQYILRDHVRLVHKDQLAPLTSCPVCGKNYGSKWKTYDHINKSHGRIFKACKACLEVFETEEQLQTHFEGAHAHLQAKAPQNPNNCQSQLPMINNVIANNNSATTDDTDTESEDDESINCVDETEKPQEEEICQKPNFVELARKENTKISLLEKRLLGKKITEEVIPKPKARNEIKIKEAPKKEIDEQVDFSNNSPNPLHNSSKRTVYVNSDEPSLCEICLKTWPAKKHLWQHYIRCHKSVAATVCGICLKTNPDYETLQHHLRSNHPTLLHGQGFGSNFICRVCGRYHNASSKLKLHMAIHENFDWYRLDEITNPAQVKPNSQVQTNGVGNYKKDSEINYDSLIEQVECSSESEDSDDGDCNKDETSSSDEEVEEEKTKESEDSETCSDSTTRTEPPIANDYLTTGGYLSSSDSSSSSITVVEESGAPKKSDVSSDEDEVTNDSDASGTTKSPMDFFQSENGSYSAFKTEELDSAIQSISYDECDLTLKEEIKTDYCDITMPGLNENEIESAVGSIL